MSGRLRAARRAEDAFGVGVITPQGRRVGAPGVSAVPTPVRMDWATPYYALLSFSPRSESYDERRGVRAAVDWVYWLVYEVSIPRLRVDISNRG